MKRDFDYVFGEMDLDKGGTLSYDEVARFLQMREGYTDEEVKVDMHDLDTHTHTQRDREREREVKVDMHDFLQSTALEHTFENVINAL